MHDVDFVDRLDLDFAKELFEFEGEDLETDLSAVKINLVHDVHYNDYELEIHIYGNDTDSHHSFPTVAVNVNIRDILEEIQRNGSMTWKMILAKLDPKFVELVKTRNVPVIWNQDDDETTQTIDVGSADPNLQLLPTE